MTDLPDWPGADVVYSRVQTILRHRAANGWVTINRHRGRTSCTPCQEMLDIIDALDCGDEEALKAFVAANLDIAVPHTH